LSKIITYMCLPFIYDEALQYPYIALGGVLFAIFYLGVERVLVFKPREVPQLWLDRQTPFLPWTIWVYQSTVPYMLVLYLLAQNTDNLNRLLFAFTTLLITSALFFFFLPTTISRDAYPIPDNIDFLTRLNFEQLRAVDHPVNCVPSMHVSMTLLFTLFFLHEHPGWWPALSIWTLLIIWSTMTTKQHFIIDVMAGAGLGVLVYALFFSGILC
jgi:membrane-associated phospholipid phosphatase